MGTVWAAQSRKEIRTALCVLATLREIDSGTVLQFCRVLAGLLGRIWFQHRAARAAFIVGLSGWQARGLAQFFGHGFTHSVWLPFRKMCLTPSWKTPGQRRSARHRSGCNLTRPSAPLSNSAALRGEGVCRACDKGMLSGPERQCMPAILKWHPRKPSGLSKRHRDTTQSTNPAVKTGRLAPLRYNAKTNVVWPGLRRLRFGFVWHGGRSPPYGCTQHWRPINASGAQRDPSLR